MVAAVFAGGSPANAASLSQAPRLTAVAAPTPTGTVAAVIRAFNAADCAQIYALTAPWARPQPQGTGIADCQQGFADGRQNGVTLLRMSADGPGCYLGPDGRAYRQPLLLRRVLDGRPDAAHETLQLVPWRNRWYVLAMW